MYFNIAKKYYIKYLIPATLDCVFFFKIEA